MISTQTSPATGVHVLRQSFETDVASLRMQARQARTITRHHNLPVQLTRFVGRTDEIEAVCQLLQRSRLVTLVGEGGCGKTRLAMEVGRKLLEEQPDGVWWVDLARSGPEQSVAALAAEALGLWGQPWDSQGDRLLQHLYDRAALLVFDNCEHLLDDSAKVMWRLLTSCPGVRLLTTSREPLGIGGEVVCRVPPLSVPAAGGGSTAADLTPFDAVRLFLDRAMAAQPLFQLDENSMEAVAQVCRQLDGMPLAIELAAARVAVLSPQEIARRLNEGLQVLAGGSRLAPPRHRTLHASMDWSHGLLDEEDRVLFRRVSVFAGRFSLEAALSVCGDESLPAGRVLDVLARLVDKSLLVVEEYGAARRYRLLKLVRQYAAQRLAESGEAQATCDRHLVYALTLVDRAEPGLVTDQQSSWHDLLEAERDNLRAALDWSIAHGKESAGLRLAGGLAIFFADRGHVVEGRRWLADALAAGSAAPSRERGRALWAASYLAFHGRDLPAACAHAGAALEMAHGLGDTATVARALMMLGATERPDRPRTARDHFQHAMDLAREAGDQWCLAMASSYLAWSWMMQSSLEPARRAWSASSEAWRNLGNRAVPTWTWLGVSMAAFQGGALAEALDAARRAHDLAARPGAAAADPFALGDGLWQAWAASCQAEIDCWRGGASEACTALAALDGQFDQSERTDGTMLLRIARGKCNLALGDLDDAGRHLGLCVEVARERELAGIEGECLVGLAEVALLRGDGAAARELAGDALRCAAVVENTRLVARAKVLLARALRAEGRIDEGAVLCLKALALQRDGGYWLDAAAALDALAGLFIERGAHREAACLIAAADAAYRDRGARRRPVDVRQHRADVVRLARTLRRAALRAAWREGAALTLAEAITHASRSRGSQRRPSIGWESLTASEMAVVRLVAEGLTNKEIARRMLISLPTVKTHLIHVFNKLDVSHRAQLAAEAVRRTA